MKPLCWILRLLTRSLYRIRAEGIDRVPERGAALLVANHVSFADGFLIGSALARRVRFLMHRDYYELPLLKPFFKAMGCIPISSAESPKALLKAFQKARDALKAGELVCIFGEGQITRHGQLLGFKRGLERIADGLDVPIVPVHLDRVWGSLLSLSGGRILLKSPRRFPYPVTVSFGEPLSPRTPASGVRQAIARLGMEAFEHRLAEKRPLCWEALSRARRLRAKTALRDSSGERLSFARAAARAVVLARTLRRAGPDEGTLPILLPPEARSAVCILAVSLAGLVPAPLPCEDPGATLRLAASLRARHLLTSRRFLETLGWPARDGMIFLEDLDTGPGETLLAFFLPLLPLSLLKRALPGLARRLEDPACVLFTSGSTGKPKAVLLSHKNLHANIEALAQLYEIEPRDILLSSLPFSHAFGYTVSLWFPMVAGFGAAYYAEPSNSGSLPRFARACKPSVLIGFPGLLELFLAPGAEPWRGLRHVAVGGEPLDPSLAKAFSERFGLEPLEGYGATELSPVAAVNIPDVRRGSIRQRGRKSGTVGQPLPGVLARVVDARTGEPLEAGETGLLEICGPNVMMGYRDEDGRVEAPPGGRYRTGDKASIDEEGFIRYEGRAEEKP